MTLRINEARVDRDTYLARLRESGLDARPHAHAAAALELVEAVPVERLPGFAEGLVSVQDAAAQLAAPLLAPVGGLRVLDACAAPGGKTAHLAELDPAMDWEEELWETLTHELRHHLEWLAQEEGLEGVDYAMEQEFRRWEGEPFDPWYFQQGDEIAEGVYRVEDADVEVRARALERYRSVGNDVDSVRGETVSGFSRFIRSCAVRRSLRNPLRSSSTASSSSSWPSAPTSRRPSPG